MSRSQIRNTRKCYESICTCTEDFHSNVLQLAMIFGDTKFRMPLKDSILDLANKEHFGIGEITGNWFLIVRGTALEGEVSTFWSLTRRDNTSIYLVAKKLF